MIVTLFDGGKTDVFPARVEDWDLPFALEQYAEDAPGKEKSEAGFACFVRMKPGTDVTVAELNLQRAKEDKRPLSPGEERIIRERGYRNYAHIAEVTAICVDYDEFPEEPPNWDPGVWPCDVYAHSTHSYDPQTLPGKWRAVLPLATPLPIEREAQLRRVLQRFLPRGAILRAPHQPAFLPTCPEGMHVEVVHVEQTEIPAELDWTKLIDMDEAPTVHASGEAAGTMLGAEFNQRGLVARDCGSKLDVVCPWANEHKSGGDLGYLYFTEDGVGKFGCAHSACKERTSADVVALWYPDERVEADAPTSPEPRPLVKDSSPTWLTGEALAIEIPPVDWVVPALEIAPGRPTILAADANAGKSWGVQTIAVAVAAGLQVFGEFACRQGTVLHVAEDSDVLAVLDRYQQIARAWGVDLAALPLAVYNREFKVCKKRDEYKPEPLEGLIKVAAEQRAALVIVDSLAAVSVGLDENSPDAARPLYASRHPTIAFLWTHHTGKEGGDYRGSSTIRAAAGAMWLMTGSGKDPRQWSNRKHSERTSSKTRVGAFTTTWEEETGRVIATREPPPARDRVRLDVLRHIARKGPSSGNGIEAEVVGQRQKIRDAYKGLAQDGILLYDGRRYHIAPGVDVEKLLRDGEG